MKLMDWVRSFLGADQSTVYVTQKAIQDAESQLAMELFAVHSAVNLISSTVSKCEFKTYQGGKEIVGSEYYLWNIEPNVNQNSSQFLQEVLSKLLLENQCLVVEVNGQLIVADSFTQLEYATAENQFTNVVKGTLTFKRSFSMREVLYFRYANEDVRALHRRMMAGYNALIGMTVGKYKRSGGRKGIAKVDKAPAGDTEFQSKIDELFNVRFRSYFEAENAVIHLPRGVDYAEDKSDAGRKATNEISDLTALTKEVYERTAQAYRIPPALLKGDIADIEKVTDNFLTFCIDPLCEMISEEINRKRYGRDAFIAGSKTRIDTTCIRHIDLFAISEAFDKLVASGGYSIDELRVKCGDAPLNEPWSKKHWITKNYTGIENPEGGTA